MTDEIAEFSDGIIGAVTVGLALQQEFGFEIISELLAINMKGEVFWEYFKSVDRDFNKVQAGLQDGSAAEYVQRARQSAAA